MSVQWPSIRRRHHNLRVAGFVLLCMAGLSAGPASPADYFIAVKKLTISFPHSPPLKKGWVTSTDIGSLVIYNYVPVTMTCSTGSNLGQTGRAIVVPLQIATRVAGKGTGSNGLPFDTGGGWGSWSGWMSSGDSTTVRFDPNQTCGMGIKAQIYRNGILDAAGTWTQSVPVTFTIIPAS